MLYNAYQFKVRVAADADEKKMTAIDLASNISL